MVQRRYPPFEIQAAPSTLAALGGRIAGIAKGVRFGPNWLRDMDGNAIPIYIDQRDLEFKFEVFSLAIPTLTELAEQVAAWAPPEVPTDAPDLIRNAMLLRPQVPTPPLEFDPWPFDNWRVDVLRRTEFILEDAEIEGAVGEAPNLQTAAPPGHAPAAASATCEVAVGLLFTGLSGGKLLIAADWMPFDTIITRDEAEITAFAVSCEVVELTTYIAQVQSDGNAP